MCGVNADRGRLLGVRTGVFVDQHVRNATRGEARVDREQLGLVRDSEHHGDRSRRSGTTLASSVGDVGGEDAFRQVFADDHVVGLGGTRSGIIGLRERRENAFALTVNASTCTYPASPIVSCQAAS